MAAERVAQICGPLWGGEVLHNYYLVFLFPAIFLILSISLMLSSWSWMDDSKFKKGKTMIFFSFSTMLEFLHQFYAKFRVPITSTLSKPKWGLKHRYSRIAIVVPFCHFSPLKWPFGAIFDSKRTENANFSGSDAPRLISVVRVRERYRDWLFLDVRGHVATPCLPKGLNVLYILAQTNFSNYLYSLWSYKRRFDKHHDFCIILARFYWPWSCS